MHNAMLVMPDGQVYYGYSVGVNGAICGELCFSTAMLGYQEAITDPSYAGQVLLFTAPHVGNVGTNSLDNEADRPLLRGVVMREVPTDPSNFRSESSLQDFFIRHGVVAIAGLDTRAITETLREKGFCNCVIQTGKLDHAEAMKMLHAMPAAEDFMPIVKQLTDDHKDTTQGAVIVIDCGVKSSIVKLLADSGCAMEVVPYDTPYEEIMARKPKGIVLSNGPGDPQILFAQIGDTIKRLLDGNIPIFGICLGHQLLALALGCKVEKMRQGHRGVNHPIQSSDKRITITTQNHGYVVQNQVPDDVSITHVSLFDGSVAGIKAKNYKAFSVQYHPEASPGTHDSYYLFHDFVAMLDN